jgi:hypothetical protein
VLGQVRSSFANGCSLSLYPTQFLRMSTSQGIIQLAPRGAASSHLYQANGAQKSGLCSIVGAPYSPSA